MLEPVEFRVGRVDEGPGATLVHAMREEMDALYEGFDLEGPGMPTAGPNELGPPHGAFLVGWAAGEAVCCGGIKPLGDGACEIKRMYVVPAWRGRGVARALLAALETHARALGYSVARLDTGPRQTRAQTIYERAGYRPIDNFNANPVASFWGEKPLAQPSAEIL